jgi:GGDEF domain-containing protein
VISLKKLLNTDPEAAGAMLRVAQLLLQGIGEHALRYDSDQHLQFRGQMEDAAAALANCAPGPDSQICVAAAIRSLEEYNRKTAQQLRVRSGELQDMVKMLTFAIGEISTTGEENVSRLRRIEGLVSSVTQIEDVRAVRAQLSVCLEEIRKEAARQKIASTSAVDRLKKDLAEVQNGPAADPVTGLSHRAQAVELISNACESELPVFAVVMVIDRLQAVNTACGTAAGDQLLRYFSGYVRRSLPSEDRIFRWTGASLLALVARCPRIDPLREQIKLLMDEKLEYTVRTPTRSVRLPVTARWALFPMMPSPRLLIQKLDTFASMVPPRD